MRVLVIVATMSVATTAIASRPDSSDRDDRDRVARSWRHDALATMHVAASSHLITDDSELARYIAAGFNTQVVFDAEGPNDRGTLWNLKSEDEIRRETGFAREHDFPLILGLATEEFSDSAVRTPALRKSTNASIPRATDDEIRARVSLWKKYGDDVIIGAFPWYDDVFWQKVDVERQRHVYQLIKDIAPSWCVLGMIGEYGIVASDEDVARYFDPSAFDHLIVLMYPYDVGSRLTGFPLDNVNSRDPDGDIVNYVDDFMTRMTNRFFVHLRDGQLIVLVGQAFYYEGEVAGHIPRPSDVSLMMQHGSELLRTIVGQEDNLSIACYWWGEEGSSVIGLVQRPDWVAAAHTANDHIAHEGMIGVRHR